MDHAEKRAKTTLAPIGLLASAAIVGFALPGEPGRMMIIVALVPAWVDFTPAGLPRLLNVARRSGAVRLLACSAAAAGELA